MTVRLNRGASFLFASDGGDLAVGESPGFYPEDTRFLSQLDLRLDDRPPVVLNPCLVRSDEAIHWLTNPALAGAPRGSLVLRRHRRIGEGLHDDLDLENFGDAPAAFVLTLHVDSDFAYIFAVKRTAEGGELRPRGAEVRREVDRAASLIRLVLDHRGLRRETEVRFTGPPADLFPDRARFPLCLGRGERVRICIDVAVGFGDRLRRASATCSGVPAIEEERRGRQGSRRAELVETAPLLETDQPLLARAYRQAVDDLAALRLTVEETAGEPTIAAGIPWFVALFGRDSLLTSWQCLATDPGLAEGTLRTLARYQGARNDAIAEEEPGKILHEYRRDVPASARSTIPKFPYYGSVDATPLFVVLLAAHARRTGDLSLVRELAGALDQALAWIERRLDADGWLVYHGKPRSGTSGLSNEGWKDSPDSVRFRDGRIAEGPIALVEVQGYAVEALLAAADLFERLGRSERSAALRARARVLRERLLERYFLPERGFFAEALDGEGHAVDALTSNAGHLLWSGVATESQARQVAGILLGPALFTGYGVRTMGSEAGGYNPVSYHNGSVWPHDTSLIAAGLVRYGLRAEATRLVEGLLAALAGFSDDRLPELFAGFPAAQTAGAPVNYPTADRPQAWASGALLLAARLLLGLEIDGFARRVTVRPALPAAVGRLALRGLPLPGRRLDIEAFRSGDRVHVRLSSLPEGWTAVTT